MKTYIEKLFLLPFLVAGLGLITASRVTAQTFTTLHALNHATEGAAPAGITLSGNTLYGVANAGGVSSSGTIFAMNTNGAGFTVLHSFSTLSNATNSDGYYLLGAPVLSGGNLYGTATEGGTSGNGTIFTINTNGTGFTVLYTFTAVPDSSPRTNSDGKYPYAGLILSGNTLYGTTAQGGTSGFGTVFKINTNGSGFTVLHTFTDGGIGDSSASLVLSGNTLFGTTRYGGTSGVGTVFAVNTNGSGFNILHNFAGSPNDGTYPLSELVLSGNTLYGTTVSGGSGFYGTVFSINTSGTGFTILHNFTSSPDGRGPEAGLTLSGNTLYGTTFGGGTVGDNGTLFSLNTDGSGYTTMYSFTAGGNGANPEATMVLSGNTLFGTALQQPGTVFSFIHGCASAFLNIAQYAGVSVSGSVGCTYEIDYTTNLNNPAWIPLITNTLLSNPFLFIDTNVVSGNRFYRAVAQ
jgi:uncharacterized repeat protein (TIGR03803 family)